MAGDAHRGDLGVAPGCRLPAGLAERFEPLGLLGAGAFGRVVKARDLELDRPVAIKLLHQAGDREAARFQREARSLAELRHQNLVAVYQQGEAEGIPYLVMEYLEGRNLAQLDDPGLGFAALVQAALGLDHLHAHGLVHRDVKPANVVRTEDGRAVLLDLGLVLDTDVARTRLTETRALTGTLAYLAPECLAGREATPSSDAYSLGASGFRILEGRDPFEAHHLLGFLAGNPLPKPGFEKAEGRTKDLVAALMDPDPGRRPVGAAARDRLLAPVSRRPRAGPRTGRRGRPVKLLLAAGIVAALGAIGLRVRPHPAGGPAPRLPPAVAVPDLRAETELELLETVEEVVRSHRGEDGTLADALRGSSKSRHLAEIAEDYLSPAFMPRLRRMLACMDAWLAANGPSGPSVPDLERVLGRRILPSMVHLAVDHGMLVTDLGLGSIPAAFRPRGALDRHDPGELLERVEQIGSVIAEALDEERVRLLDRLPENWRLLMIATMCGAWYREGSGRWIDRVLAALEAGQLADPGQDLSLALVGLTMVTRSPVGSTPGLDPERRARLHPRLWEAAARRAVAGDPTRDEPEIEAARLRLAAYTLFNWFLVEPILEATERTRLEALGEAVLTRLEAGVAAGRATPAVRVFLDWYRTQSSIATYLVGFGSAPEAWTARVRVLLDRLYVP